MLEELVPILEIQEFDMQMIQLMNLRRSYQDKLDALQAEQETVQSAVSMKEQEIMDLKTALRLVEGEISELDGKFKKLESQQHAIKKVEEFNALNHEMSQIERERSGKKQRIAEAQEKLTLEEEILATLQKELEATIANNKAIESEIHESIHRINEEGRGLKIQRDQLISKADPEVFRIYERLLRNKRDRVVVPIENRCCSGCHIMLTAQDENMVRKGERLVFCEHCSRIHYWQESEVVEGSVAATKQRRRRSSAKA